MRSENITKIKSDQILECINVIIKIVDASNNMVLITAHWPKLISYTLDQRFNYDLVPKKKFNLLLVIRSVICVGTLHV